jgi:serine/threonine protein kinase
MSRILAKRYRIIGMLKEGTFFSVHRGWDEPEKRAVAIKILKVDNHTDTNLSEIKEKLETEIEYLNSLKHPAIPQYYDIIVDESIGEICLVMEWIEGKDLYKVICNDKQSTYEGVLWYMECIVENLRSIPRQKGEVEPKDLKPASIVFGKEGEVKFIDFGTQRLLKAVYGDITYRRKITSYDPPEASVEGVELDQSSDVYSIGAIAYHLCTGENPGDHRPDFPPAHELNPTLSEKFSEFLSECLGDYGHRIRDMESLYSRIQKEKKYMQSRAVADDPTESTIVGGVFYVVCWILLLLAYVFHVRGPILLLSIPLVILALPYVVVFSIYYIERVVRGIITREEYRMNKSTLNKSYFAFLVIFLITAGGHFMSSDSFKDLLAAGQFKGCTNNLKTITVALEGYAFVNGVYPETLQKLVPDYMAGIPKCPACGLDTYSGSYTAKTKGSAYLITCKGENHSRHVKAPGDWPQFDSKKGMLEVPEDVEKIRPPQ